ncbi:MAG: hypothetical protein QMD17_14845 [Rhodocyclaceae bacterium]|jgi:hypothetical protein|nr:hypothetical protein [Rhodocyclaceae bacterium]
MPYYIYRVSQLGPIKQLDKLAEFPVFKNASDEAKRLRKEIDLTNCQVKIIFGENEFQAEEALRTVREGDPRTGEES